MTSRRIPVGVVALLALTLGDRPAAQADVPLHTLLEPQPFHSAHQDEMLRHLGAPPPAYQPAGPPPALAAKAGPDVTVYGYWPYWGDDISTLPWDSLTHVAIFSVDLASDGTLTNTSRWTNVAAKAVSLAHPYGVKVDLVVTCFDSTVMSSVFGSSTRRATAISNIKSLIDAYGADGVNLDIEGLPSSQKANFVTFVQQLRPAVKDLFLATPAVDWSGAYDYDVLAASSDGMFIMGYDYHYGGGSPGPVSPLFGGSPWGTYSIQWTVNDYQTWGTPIDKMVLGLPLYGFKWPTTNNTVPGTSTGTATSQTYVQAVANATTYGRKWDAASNTPYAFPSTTSQLWYDDVESLEDKIDWALAQGLQGIGFWALTYEDSAPTFWNMVDSLTTAPTCDQIDADKDGSNACVDCNDGNAALHPGALEACDGIDNNCDGQVDNAADADKDGSNACVDCNDGNAAVHPGALEACDGIDNNCDALVDNAADTDGDGFNVCSDCDDARPVVYPGAIEACDGLDNNCDALIDNTPDGDGDGVNQCLDCDDNDPSTSPDQAELPHDGIDNNCDGQIDENGAGGCSGPGGGGTLNPRGLAAVSFLGLAGLLGRRRQAR